MAHELRTPLAGQRIVLESLEKRLSGAREQEQGSVTMALRENLRLGDLAEIFLTFSKLDRGILKIDRHPLILHQVDRRLNRAQGGLELGLSIVKRLMAGMSGRTEIDNERGSGTTFRSFLRKEENHENTHC